MNLRLISSNLTSHTLQTLPIEFQLSTEQNRDFKKAFGTLQEVIPNLSNNSISFSSGELLWFCARWVKSQFLSFEKILTDTNHALQSNIHSGLRVLFENIICRLKNPDDTPPQKMTPENQTVYDFVIKRIESIEWAKQNAKTRARLTLVQ